MTQAQSYQALWTDTAKQTINKIVGYLRKEWTEKEVDAFLDEVDRTVNAIEIYPKLFRQSTKRKNIHLALISKHTILVYQIRPNKKQIALLLFWGTRQSPKKLKY
jgi:plasmid stabilization system protein ParE